MATNLDVLFADEATIPEDIDDFLEENVVADLGHSVEDYDMINKNVEGLRSAYRGKHNQLKSVFW